MAVGCDRARQQKCGNDGPGNPATTAVRGTYRNIAMEITLGLVFLIIGLFVALRRAFAKASVDVGSDNFMYNVKASEKYALSAIEHFDIPYKQITIKQPKLDVFAQSATGYLLDGKFTIVAMHPIDNHVFIQLRIDYSDFDLKWNGEMGEVKKTDAANFLLTYEPDIEKLTLNGVMFHNLTDKLHYQEFATSVLTIIENQFSAQRLSTYNI